MIGFLIFVAVVLVVAVFVGAAGGVVAGVRDAFKEGQK